MKSKAWVVAAVLAAFGLGHVLTWWSFHREGHGPKDAPALVVQIREAARLETLDVRLYKKVSFEPDPQPAQSFWGEVVNWARFSLNPPKGKAIVFAEAHFGLDLGRLQVSNVRPRGDRVEMVLPPVKVSVELKPGDTEVIGSNLDSAQTAKLFELAKDAFEREAAADLQLRERARASAERAIRALLLGAGYREVDFVDHLEPANAG